MLENYLPVLIFLVIGLAVGAVMIALGFVLSPHKPDDEKTLHTSVDLKHLAMRV